VESTSQKTFVLILGAGRGGLAMLELFLEEELVSVIGIADLNQDSPGIQLAKAHGISTFSDPIEAIRVSVDFHDCIVYNLTHDESIATKAAIIASKTKVVGGSEAKLLWNMVTNMKRMRKQLEDANIKMMQSEKMASIGQLAAGVAHEINNPIGFVYSNLGSLEKYMHNTFVILDQYEQAEALISDSSVRAQLKVARDKLDIAFLKADLNELINESKDGIRRIKNIVQNLKDFSHDDSCDEWKFFNLHNVLDDTLNIVNSEINQKAKIVKVYGDLPIVECLSTQLEQVFLNLLVNAAQAIEEKGVITIQTGRQGDEVWVKVGDTGKGIAPENIKKIFDPFFTTKPIGMGTGLGLSLAYGIIKKHKGRIEVQSEVGKGTAFRVWLPIKQATKA